MTHDPKRDSDDGASENMLRRLFNEFRLTMRDEMRTGFDEFDKRLTATRKADFIAGLQEWSELRIEDMPELRKYIQDELQDRRDRRERFREIAGAVRGGVWEVVKHAISAALVIGAGYLGWTNWIK